MPRSGWPATLGLLVLALSFSGEDRLARGHDLTRGVGTQSYISFFPDRIRIKLNFGASPGRGLVYLNEMDTNGDERVDKDEKEAWLTAMGPGLVEGIDLTANGRPVKFEIQEHFGLGILGDIQAVPFDTYYTIEGELPRPLLDGGWWLHFNDETFRDETSSQFVCPLNSEEGVTYLIFEPEGDRIISEPEGFRIPGRHAVLYMDTEFRSDRLPGSTPVPSAESLAAMELRGDGSAAEETTERTTEEVTATTDSADSGAPGETPEKPPQAATDRGERWRPGWFLTIGIVAFIVLGVEILMRRGVGRARPDDRDATATPAEPEDPRR